MTLKVIDNIDFEKGEWTCCNCSGFRVKRCTYSIYKQRITRID